MGRGVRVGHDETDGHREAVGGGRRRPLGAELARSLTAERAARAAAEHAAEWIEPLRAAATEAVTAVSLDAVIRDCLTAVASSLGVDAAAVLIASDDRSHLIARASVGLTQEVDLGVNIPAGAGFAGRILASGEPLIIDDLEHFEVVSPVLRSSGLRSLMGVPLLVSGEIVGVMHLGSRELAHFAEDELAILESLAYPIAAAIERVRLFEIERTLREEAELTAKRLAALQRITSALAGARSMTEVCETIAEKAVVSQRAGTGETGIWMLKGGRLLLVTGGPAAEAFMEIPLDPSLPAAAHLAGAPPLFVETRAELLKAWPVLESTKTAAFAAFPLVIGGVPVGVMAVAYHVDHHFDENEKTFLTAVAEQAGVALERARAAEVEEAVHGRRSFLAEMSLALTNRYASPTQLLETLARLAVPRLADYCTVLLERSGGFRSVARASHSSAPDPIEADIERARSGGESLLEAVFRSRRPIIVERPGTETECGGDNASIMLVPFENHGRAVGVMAFVACGEHPAYHEEDLEMAEELAARAGRLVEDLTQRERERELAEALTRALLPPQLPRLPGVELAARYVPAEAGPVGGDWYDAFPLPDSHLGLVVGDVGGHGVEAASAMARLRNGLFAFASEGHDPPSIFERLSGLLAYATSGWTIPDPIASVLFATIDLETLVAEVTCAGHPPWLLVREGRAELKDCGGRVLAGSLPSSPAAAEHQLEAGDTCIFMTDGLVERPGEELSVSLDRLAAAAEENASLASEELADRLLEATAPPRGRHDDCCVLVLRITRTPDRPPQQGRDRTR